MTAEDCAARIVRAIEKRERLVLMSARGQARAAGSNYSRRR